MTYGHVSHRAEAGDKIIESNENMCVISEFYISLLKSTRQKQYSSFQIHWRKCNVPPKPNALLTGNTYMHEIRQYFGNVKNIIKSFKNSFEDCLRK